MAVKLLCDTGPLVAFLNRSDQYHSWAKRQFDNISAPLVTCEAVISEAVFLIEDDGLSTDPLSEVIDRGMLKATFSADAHWPDLRRLIRKYQDQPMSFADACLVRMSELVESCQVFTTDSDFRVYRRYGRQVIPLLCPFD
jgi:uncharacterized protein